MPQFWPGDVKMAQGDVKLQVCFYITTVVINKKKSSFDVLCIEIIVNVQNDLFPQIFFVKYF